MQNEPKQYSTQNKNNQKNKTKNQTYAKGALSVSHMNKPEFMDTPHDQMYDWVSHPHSLGFDGYLSKDYTLSLSQ